MTIEIQQNITSLNPLNIQNYKLLPLLPLKNIVTMPTNIIPIIVGRKSSINSVETALTKYEKCIFVTAQKNEIIENPKKEDLFEFGTFAKILQTMKMPNGSVKILIEGISIGKIININKNDSFLSVNIELINDKLPKSKLKLEALYRHLLVIYKKYTELNSKLNQEIIKLSETEENKSFIVYSIITNSNLSLNEKQTLLETTDFVKKINKLISYLKKEVSILELEQKIRSKMNSQIEKNQREYYLQEQIKAINQELGRDSQTAETEKLKKKIKKLNLPKKVVYELNKEFAKIESLPNLSSEAAVSKNYIDSVISLPWNKSSKDNINLETAEAILNSNHFGLEKAKERIIEFIATKKFSSKINNSTIICLIGPPGVGKTSLAASIAKSLNREFYKITLGGVKDEAEIRGHRRTYIGALPGKIIQSLQKVKTINPVILLDEIDKLSKDFAGDPASALLEVLDPEQNKTFNDRFIDLDYDLSNIIFIATANYAENIPLPLYDRMEKIYLSGYTEAEKFKIVKQFIIKKALKTYLLESKNINFEDSALKKIISEYTKEAGVRQLSRIIEKFMRKSIQEFLKNKHQKIIINDEKVSAWLGFPKFKKTELSAESSNKVGIATGLAWTELGGDVLEIEVILLNGKGTLSLTGQLGEIMQESAQTAFSFVKSKFKELGLKKSIFNNKDIHIHIPEGATPKDGPSAGITICTAIVSALKNLPVKKEVAMTGEITLTGRVLSIGGLKEKLLAAEQYNKTTVLIPESNRSDFEEIKADIKNSNIVFVKDIFEVLINSFEKNPFIK